MVIHHIEVQSIDGRIIDPERWRNPHERSWDEIERLVRSVNSMESYGVTIEGPEMSVISIDGNGDRFVVSGCFSETGSTQYLASDGELSEFTTEFCVCGQDLAIPESCLLTADAMVGVVRFFCDFGKAESSFRRWPISGGVSNEGERQSASTSAYKDLPPPTAQRPCEDNSGVLAVIRRCLSRRTGIPEGHLTPDVRLGDIYISPNPMFFVETLYDLSKEMKICCGDDVCRRITGKDEWWKHIDDVTLGDMAKFIDGNAKPRHVDLDAH